MKSEIIYSIGSFFSHFKTVKYILAFFEKVRTLFYSGYWGTQMSSVGKKFRLQYPVRLVNGPQYMVIGDCFNSFPYLRIEAINMNGIKPELKIGNDVSFNHNCQINCVNKVVIGNGCLFASNIFITDHYHGLTTFHDLDVQPSLRPICSKGPVVIEDNVWIGQNVSIMPNVTIGRGSVIGANSVVTHDIPAYAIAAGVPAQIIKQKNK